MKRTQQNTIGIICIAETTIENKTVLSIVLRLLENVIVPSNFITDFLADKNFSKWTYYATFLNIDLNKQRNLKAFSSRKLFSEPELLIAPN